MPRLRQTDGNGEKARFSFRSRFSPKVSHIQNFLRRRILGTSIKNLCHRKLAFNSPQKFFLEITLNKILLLIDFYSANENFDDIFKVSFFSQNGKPVHILSQNNSEVRFSLSIYKIDDIIKTLTRGNSAPTF